MLRFFLNFDGLDEDGVIAYRTPVSIWLEPAVYRSATSCIQVFILSQNSKLSCNALQFAQAQIAGSTRRVVQQIVFAALLRPGLSWRLANYLALSGKFAVKTLN